MSDRPRINEQIRASLVRVTDEKGVSLGVLTVPEALEIARRAGLDLVEVDAASRISLCRIMDFGKAEYERIKSERRKSG
jgi:translation initiation factor IF-3